MFNLQFVFVIYLSAYRPNKGTLKLHLYYKLGNIWSAPGAKQSFF